MLERDSPDEHQTVGADPYGPLRKGLSTLMCESVTSVSKVMVSRLIPHGRQGGQTVGRLASA